jgi:hypothetical protein
VLTSACAASVRRGRPPSKRWRRPRHRLTARGWVEPVDPSRRKPAVEPKGATHTAIEVGRYHLEVQEVVAVDDGALAAAFSLHLGEVMINIHGGSRGLGTRTFGKSDDVLGSRTPDRSSTSAEVADDDEIQHEAAIGGRFQATSFRASRRRGGLEYP